MGSPAESEAGSYRAVWLPVRDLVGLQLKPKSIAAALSLAPDPEWLMDGWLETPVGVRGGRVKLTSRVTQLMGGPVRGLA